MGLNECHGLIYQAPWIANTIVNSIVSIDNTTLTIRHGDRTWRTRESRQIRVFCSGGTTLFRVRLLAKNAQALKRYPEGDPHYASPYFMDL